MHLHPQGPVAAFQAPGWGFRRGAAPAVSRGGGPHACGVGAGPRSWRTAPGRHGSPSGANLMPRGLTPAQPTAHDYLRAGLSDARNDAEQARHALDVATARHAADLAVLRGELDRQVSQLADLRAALQRPAPATEKAPDPQGE